MPSPSSSTSMPTLSFGAIYRQARRIKKVSDEATEEDRPVEKMKRKRKIVAKEDQMKVKARIEELEEGEIISSDEEDKENQPPPIKRTRLSRATELEDPEDEEEYFLKLRALFHGQKYVELPVKSN